MTASALVRHLGEAFNGTNAGDKGDRVRVEIRGHHRP